MAITFNTIPANVRVPLFYAEMDNSRANRYNGSLRALVIGQMTTGKAVAGDLTMCNTIEDAVALFGIGSQVAKMAEYFRKGNTATELWALPIADSGTKASGTITVGGTIAAGVIPLYIGSQKVQVTISTTDTTTTIATAIAAAINAITDLPVTAVAAAAVVTLTARNGGAVGNDIKLTIAYRGLAGNEVLPAGLTITFSATDAATGYGTLASGTGTMVVPITALGDEEFDFIVLAQADATTLDALKTEMNDTTGRWSYSRQVFGHVYSALRGTNATLQTFGQTRNDQHATNAGFELGILNPVWEFSAAYTAANAGSIAADPAMPTQTLELVGVLPPKVGKRFVFAERQSLLNNGIATSVYKGGAVRVERAITSYLKNAQGVADISYLDSETMHTSAYFLRRIATMVTSIFGRCKLANDGTEISVGQAVVTPQIMRGYIEAEYSRMESEGIVESADLFSKYTVIERNPNDANRLDMLLVPDYVNQLRVVAVKSQFRLQY